MPNQKESAECVTQHSTQSNDHNEQREEPCKRSKSSDSTARTEPATATNYAIKNPSLPSCSNLTPRETCNPQPTDKPKPSCCLASTNNTNTSKTSPGKLKISPSKSNLRAKPYSKQRDDGLPPLEQMSLQGDCRRDGCQCSLGTKREDSSLNLARACCNGIVVREARLRLRNVHKDQREVMRATRLKLHQRANHTQHIALSKPADLTSQLPANKPGNSAHHTGAFQAAPGSNVKSFASLAAPAKTPSSSSHNNTDTETSKHNCSKQQKDFSGSSFSLLRPSSSEERLSLQSLAKELPLVSDTGAGRASVDTAADPVTCAQQALLQPDDLTVEELACYLEDFVYIPRKMSSMAEMMYT